MYQKQFNNLLKMKLKLNNHYYSAMAVLLPLLGFQSCDDVFNFNQKCEYGCPTADYKFKGDVTTEDATPVKGIKVVVIQKYDSKAYRIDSTLTNEQGKYLISRKKSAIWNLDYDIDIRYDNLYITFEDIDGKDNGGSFTSDTLKNSSLKVTKIKDGDGNWYNGEFEIEGNIKLKKNE